MIKFFCPAGLEKGPAGLETHAGIGCPAGLGKRFGKSRIGTEPPAGDRIRKKNENYPLSFKIKSKISGGGGDLYVLQVPNTG